VLRARLLAGVAAGVLTLAACSAGGTVTPTSSTGGAAPGPAALADALAAADGPVRITVWHGLGGVGGTALDAAIADFNAQHEGQIEATAVYQGTYQDTLAKYTSAVRDQATPSVLVINDVTTGYLRDVGQTVPAQSLAAANPDGLDLDQLRPAARNYYSADGELLAVPLATSMPLLYVNDELLDQAGVDRASLTTLSGVTAAAHQVADRVPGAAGLVQPFDGWWFEQLTAAAGATWCGPDNGRGDSGADRATFTDPAQVAAIQSVADLYTSGAGLDTGIDGNAAVSAFAAGDVAMMVNSSGSIGALTAGGTEFSALPYPVSSDPSSAGPLIGGAAMWVSGPGHPDAEQVASWELVSYLASAPVQERFSQATGYAPVNTEVDASPTQQSFLADHPATQVLVDQFADTPVSTATAGCLTGAMTAIRLEVVDLMQSAFDGTTTVPAALDRAEQTADRILSDYHQMGGR
jgi:sn-glycerol 3-phosphate transport system substrate-binding protein